MTASHVAPLRLGLMGLGFSYPTTFARLLRDDAPRMGGWTIVNMGIHGMEPLVALLGPDLRSGL